MNEKNGFISKQMVRMQRGRFYASMLQFFLVAVLTVRTFDTQALIGVPKDLATILLIPTTIILVWSIGYIDDKIGLLSGMKNYHTKRNPILKEVSERLKRIEESDKNVR